MTLCCVITQQTFYIEIWIDNVIGVKIVYKEIKIEKIIKKTKSDL